MVSRSLESKGTEWMDVSQATHIAWSLQMLRVQRKGDHFQLVLVKEVSLEGLREGSMQFSSFFSNDG